MAHRMPPLPEDREPISLKLWKKLLGMLPHTVMPFLVFLSQILGRYPNRMISYMDLDENVQHSNIHIWTIWWPWTKLM